MIAQTIVSFFACLSCGAHGCRWQTSDGQRECSQNLHDAIASLPSSHSLVEVSSLRALTSLMLAFNSVPAFNPSGPLVGSNTRRSKVVGCARRDMLAATAATLIGLSQLRLPAMAAGAAPATLAKPFTFKPKITRDAFGSLSRYEDQLVGPKGAASLSVSVSFLFPQVWSQLGSSDGIQFVDGNSGLRAYVLTAPLPSTPLLETPKAWFGDSIFSPEGAIVRTGTTIEEYKVAGSKQIDAPEGAVPTRRRLSMKYSVITPANQRSVERRAVVDAYEVEGVAFMFVATASENKWDGGDKQRCESSADSFSIGVFGETKSKKT